MIAKIYSGIGLILTALIIVAAFISYCLDWLLFGPK